MRSPTLARLAAIFGRVGILTFGGGDPTMAALYAEFVSLRQWLSPVSYGMAYALARLTPGTNVLAFCAGTAWQMLGLLGAITAVLAATLPSAVLVVLFTAGYEWMKSSPLAQAAIAGLLAAAVGMMGTGAWQLLAPQFSAPNRRRLRALLIFGLALALSVGAGVQPLAVLGLGALIGFLWP